MFLLGIGTAFPNHSLSDSDLTALGLQIRSGRDSVGQRAGVSSRRVSLPLDYIRGTGNVDVLDAWKVATSSPTALGVEAVRAALAQAGIGVGSLGLVIADSGTPYQTCPSEAQRIAGEFGLKIPAYDVTRGVSALPHFLSLFSEWKAERLPDYSICISTNTPSQHVRYKDDAASAELFGDAAVAVIFSKKHHSPMRVLHSTLAHEKGFASPIVIEGALALNREMMVSEGELSAFINGELDRLAKVSSSLGEKALFIAPQMYAAEGAEILRQRGVSSERVVSGTVDGGFALGSSYGVALAASWDRLRTGTPVVMLHCGDGLRGALVVGGESGGLA